ncbi:non-ribosomal peptide synthase protein (TIGR01720 family)/amino acid adenylation domain-containing protein, partial [Nonlabens dokdonensis]
MKKYSNFINTLKINNEAIWVEDNVLKLFILKQNQNEEIKDFIRSNKDELITILYENEIFSKEKFKNTLIFKNKTLVDFPLSYAQNRLWFVEHYESGTNAYHIPSLLEVSANADVEGIKYSLQQVVSRHEVLRSTLAQDKNNRGIQKVCDFPLSIEEISLGIDSDYEQQINKDINRPFDLSSGYPIRVKLYKIASIEKTLLLINLHHIAGDGWSMGIFQRELLAYYEAYFKGDMDFKLPDLEIQYKDYALWQREYLIGSVLEEQLSYWKDKLSGYQTLNFPTDYSRPLTIDYKGASEGFRLSKDLSDKLRKLSRLRGVTLNSVLLSSVNILFGKYTGQDDIVIGSVTANRHYRQIEDLIGFFVNTQVNRTRLNNSQSFESLIDNVHKDQIEAQLYQDLPFENLIEELGVVRDSSRHAIFQVTFGLQSFGSELKVSEAPKSFLKPYYLSDSYEIEKFDLSVFVDDSGEELVGQISYATSLFKSETITKLINHYIHLLTELTTTPARPYAEISLLNSVDYNQIIHSWNATDTEYSNDKTLIDLFEEQVLRTPDNISLVYENQELTYGELNKKSNQLARHIRSRYKERTGTDLKSDTLIVLCLDRSLEMIIGILGVLKAGGAYVPMDPSYPQDRIDYILEDTKSELVLSQRDILKDKDATLPVELVVYIDLTEPLYKDEDGSVLPSYSSPNDLAYIIYTSGTTGNPKGVMVEHSSVTNLICDLKIKYRIENLERFLLFANYVFDASCEQMNLCLLSGGILFIPSKETIRDFEKFINFVQNNVITHLNATPSYLASLDPLKLKSVKRTIFGGEYLSIEVFESYKKYIPIVINVYGPTETTISSLVSINTYLLNKPSIQNTKIYILDDADQPVPVGVVGELYIGGAGLSRGYLNNEKLTSERFVSNPFATEKDIEKGYTRLYKTGDLVRWLPGGNLEYIGRNDDQVKIRGYRIELGEIEYALRSIEGITQSCILAKERETDLGFVKYLVGYYVLESDVSEAFILDALSKVLPDYMIPSSLVKMDSFPLTINGKLDKKGLPAPEFTVSDDLYVAPTTETEKVLCGIWEEVLGIGRVGVTDDFFRIGGDSILSIQVSSRIRQLGFSCNVRDIFESKTISKLILLIEAKDSKEFIKSEQGVLEGDFDLLPIQQWFLERVNVNLLGSANHWNQSFLVRVPALDTAKLLSILASLVSHHDMLRIGYRMEGDSFELKQFYQSNISIPELRTLDVNLLSKEELHLALTQWQSSFNLELGPLFQVGYLHGYEDDSARIYFALHHMLVDGVSWRILSDDLKKLYIGESLGLKGSSYRQWVSSIRNYTKANPEEGLYWESQFNGLPHYNQLVSDSSQSTSYLELEESYTRILLQDISTAYYTEINDLLLTALGYALKDVNGLDIQGITLEGHGREPIDPAIDHSHTLGWFTSIFPVKLELKDSLRGSIQFIKDTLHRVPNKGIGFGSFAVSGNSTCAFSDLAPISFNYLGQFEVGDEARDWEVVTSEDSGMPIGPLNQDHTIININGAVQKGRLGFRIDSKLGAQATEDFSNSFKHHLIAIIAHCQDSLEELGSLYSSSDFESVDLSQSLLDDLQVAASSTQNSISGIYPASSLQQGFIYHAISQPEDDAYRVQLLYDYHDALDIDKYLQAWEYCIAEYPILRTSFNWEEELIQVVYRRGHLEYELHDISELVKQEARDQKIKSIQLLDRGHGFDLTKPSLFRLHIIKQSETLYTILKTDHHSIGDGWSGPALLKSLDSYYESLIAGESIDVKEDIAYLKTQEYIYTHKSVVSNYWDGLLSEVEGANDINALLSNPIDLTSYRIVGNPGSNAIEIKGSVYEELKSFSQREGVTINVIVQFIWHKLLQVYSSSPHSIVGTTVSGRDLPIEGIEESVGLFINTLPLVVNWDNDNSILSQLHDIQKQITGLNSNSFADLSKLQKGEGRLFHSLFVFENYPTPKGSSREISKARMRDAIEKSDYPLNIKAYEYSDALTIELQYDGDYLTEEKVNSHLVRLEQILGQVISTPDQLHSGISLLNSEEYDQIVHSWNATDVDYPSDRTIYGMFEEQVEKSPDNIALVYEGSELTYKELNERSNQLARHLRAGYQGRTGEELGPDTLIALCLDRGLEMIIGILGVLKA